MKRNMCMIQRDARNLSVLYVFVSCMNKQNQLYTIMNTVRYRKITYIYIAEHK